MQIPMVALSFFAGLPFGLAAFFWLGPMRLVIALHAQCFVNSIGHMRQDAGPGEGPRKNIAWLALMHFFQGENWHQNHHDRPGSARLGWTLLQIDFGWYTILLLEKLGLAKDVRRPTSERSRRGSLDAAPPDARRRPATSAQPHWRRTS